MKVDKLILSPYRKYTNKIFDFESGITRIYGPVGSGKSTIMKAMLCAIYNKHRPSGEFYIDFWFTLNGQKYQFIRSDKEFKLFIDGEEYGKNKAQRTQYVKDNFVDYKVFISTLFYKQKNFSTFTKAGLSEKKELFSKIQNMEDWSIYHKHFRSKLLELTQELSTINGSISMLESIIDEIGDLNLATEEFKTNKIKLNKLDDRVKIVTREIEKCSTEISDYNSIAENNHIIDKYEKLTKQIKKFESDKDKFKIDASEVRASLSKIQKLSSSTTNYVNKAHSEIVKYESKLSETKKYLNSIENLMQKAICPILSAECPLSTKHSADLNKMKVDCVKEIEAFEPLLEYNQEEYTTYKSQLDKEEAEIQKLQSKEANIANNISILDNNIKTNKMAITDLGDIPSSRIDLPEISECKSMYNKLNSELTGINNERVKLSTTINHIDDNIKRYEDSKHKLSKLISSAKKISKDIKTYEELKRIFSKNGLPLYFTKKYISHFKELVNKVLAEISEFSIDFDMGRVVNAEDTSIDLIINTPYGMANYEDDLSGGEQTMIDFAIGISLSEMMMIRNGVQYGTIFFDEILGALDDVTADRVVRMANLLKKRFNNTFIISHKSNLPDIFDNVILCEG